MWTLARNGSKTDNVMKCQLYIKERRKLSWNNENYKDDNNNDCNDNKLKTEAIF